MTTIGAVEEPTRGIRAREWMRGDLVHYVLRRARSGLVVILLVALTVFIVARLGSDPAQRMVPIDATPAQYEAVKRHLGLDTSIPAQLVTYGRQLVSLDLGRSYWLEAPVSTLIAERLPNTVLLVAVAIGFASIVGVLLGIIAALRPGSWLDQGLAVFSLVGLSMPQFFLGTVLILLFSIVLNVLPTSGFGSPSHLVMPALTLAMPCLGRVAQVTRAAMIDELAKPHIRVARAKGLGGAYVVVRHALRNVMVPIVTLCGYETAYALAGYSVVVETVFAWPGIGYLTIQAIGRQDLILVQGIVLVSAVIVVAINLVTDLAYKVIDPRIDLS